MTSMGINDSIPAVDSRTADAFKKTARRMHKNNAEMNRTFSLSFLSVLFCGIVTAFTLRMFIAEPTKVDGKSMQHTLLNGESVLVEKVSYWFHEPQRGEVVIINYPGSSARFVKRIIALPGETIEIRRDGFVYINGDLLDESAYAGDWYGSIRIPITTKGSVKGRFTVPEGHYFVIGDNRNDSKDSRNPEVGPIPFESILGRVRAVVWPPNAIRPAG